MRPRSGIALLLLLSACATTEPRPQDQAVIPWVTPLVAPKPIALPVPVGLTPPVPVMVDPNAHKKQEPEGAGSNRAPPVPLTTGRRRPECEPVPKPHRGGDALHDWCADTFPPNRYPGNDVLVDGKLFDSLQVGAPVLWEIKTDRFDTYSDFLQEQVIRDQTEELRRERDIAEACRYGFVVGVSSASHKAALEAQEPLLHIVLTGCDR